MLVEIHFVYRFSTFFDIIVLTFEFIIFKDHRFCFFTFKTISLLIYNC